MNFSWWTFALQAVNFLILIWLLRRFLFKPVTAIVARRKEEIARGMTEASAEKQKALDLQRDLQAQLAGIGAERQKAIEEQRAQLAAERKKTLDDAREEAGKIRDQAAARLNEERSAAAQELFSQTVQLAISLAERLLGELALPSLEHAFLTRALDYLDHLPADGIGRAGFASGPTPHSWSPQLTRSTQAAKRNGARSSAKRIGARSNTVQQRSGAYRRRRNRISQRNSPLQLARLDRQRRQRDQSQ